MSRYHKFLGYSVFTILLWMVLAWFQFLPWYALGILLLFLISRIVVGAIFIQQNFFLTSLNSLQDVGISPEEKRICLTFDDGIHPENTQRVLQILRAKNITAMFFLIGKHCENQSSIIQQMQADGHVLGNHSYQHDFWFDLKNSQTMLQELKQTNTVLESQGAARVRYVRPPYGVTNPSLARAVNSSGLISIGWNLRSLDTVAKSKQDLLQSLKSKTKANSIILLHDRCDLTVQVLTEYIEYCLAEGYTFVTLSN